MKNNIIHFMDPRRSHEEIREQACLWLARLDAGATPQEREQLAAWLAESPHHGRMLLNMAAMWDLAGTQLSELSEIFPLAQKSLALQSARRRFLALAASVAAVSTLGGGTWFALRAMGNWQQSFETAVGGRKQVDLPDGSELTLNTDTRLRVQFSRNERKVLLERGEGFFSVASDAQRPFRVYVGSRVVEAVGTAFTVQHTQRKDLEIMVTEGKVNFLELAVEVDSAKGEAASSAPPPAAGELPVQRRTPVVAGERVTVTQNAQALERATLQPEELELKTAWRVGMLVFQGDTLETVLQEVSRYTTVRLEAEESIRDIQIEGYFRAGDINGLLVSMERNFKIGSEEAEDGRILLTARKQE